MKLNALAVYCGASKGNDPVYTEEAFTLGKLLAERGIRLVYGGGGIGLMGAVADGALSGGGAVTGVIPERLMSAELGHKGVADLRVVESMHDRKAAMATLADAFVVLPGGLGTMDELFEAATWTQLAYHEKPCGVLNVRGYYDPLRDMLERMIAADFVPDYHRSLILFEERSDALVDALAAWKTPGAKFSFLKAQNS